MNCRCLSSFSATLLRQHHGAFGESRAGAKGRANLGLNAISLWQQHYSGKKRTHTPEIRDISTKNNKKNQPSSTTVANHFPLHFLIALLPHKDNKDSLIWLRILEKRGLWFVYQASGRRGENDRFSTIYWKCTIDLHFSRFSLAFICNEAISYREESLEILYSRRGLQS